MELPFSLLNSMNPTQETKGKVNKRGQYDGETDYEVRDFL